MHFFPIPSREIYQEIAPPTVSDIVLGVDVPRKCQLSIPGSISFGNIDLEPDSIPCLGQPNLRRKCNGEAQSTACRYHHTIDYLMLPALWRVLVQHLAQIILACDRIRQGPSLRRYTAHEGFSL